MIAWYWLIVAFCVGIAFATFTDEWFDWNNTLTDILAGITLVIVFIPLWIYSFFFKLTFVYPVSPEKFENAKAMRKDKEKTYHLFGNLYLWIDPQAKAIFHKIFLLRVKNNT